MYDEPVGETFGDGGVPCARCRHYVEDHELTEPNEAGQREWVCPA